MQTPLRERFPRKRSSKELGGTLNKAEGLEREEANKQSKFLEDFIGHHLFKLFKE